MSVFPQDRTLTNLYAMPDERFPLLIGHIFFRYKFNVYSALSTLKRGKSFKSWNVIAELSFHMETNGDELMARKSKQTGKASGTSNAAASNEVKWINIQLTDADYEQLSETEFSPEYCTHFALDTARRGGQFGIKPSPRDDGFMCYIIAPADDDNSVQLGVSGYASSPDDAALCLLYKVDVICAGKLTTDRVAVRTARRFG